MMMMIEDESEPSFCPEFNFSSTSTIFSDEGALANSKSLKRRQSVSLHNLASTPHIQQASSSANNHSSSQHAMDTNRKPKRRRYDHIESKIKRNLVESKRQQKAMKEQKRQEDQLRRAELDRTGGKINTEDILSNDPVDIKLLSTQFVTLEEKYSETLHKIDSIQLELAKIKGDGCKPLPFITPRTVHKRNNMQTSMIKTLLFNTSTSGHCRTGNNTPGISLFEGDSTCMTLDIADVLPLSEEITQFNNNGQLSFNGGAVVKENPFLVQSLSPASTRSYHSESPLLLNYTERKQPKNKFRTFLYKLVRCPKVRRAKRRKIYNCYAMFKNKVTPDTVPKVVVHSPSDNDSDSGHHSDDRINRIRGDIFRKSNKNNWVDYKCGANQELLLEQLTQCADELTCKLNAFKTLAAEYLNKKSE